MESNSERNTDSSAYFLGNLQGAVYALATHPGDAKTRLGSQEVWVGFLLSRPGVPPHLIGEYDAIMKGLTSRCRQLRSDACWAGADTWVDSHGTRQRSGHPVEIAVRGNHWVEADSLPGRMLHTTRTMRNRTAARLAGRIYTLSLEWKGWLGL